MHTFPHAECPGITEAFAGLAGLSVARGLHPGGPGPLRWAQGLHPSRAAGPLPRPGGHPGGHLPPGPGRRRTATQSDLLSGDGSPWARRLLPRLGRGRRRPIRSWPPAGGRASVPIRHPRWSPSARAAASGERRLGGARPLRAPPAVVDPGGGRGRRPGARRVHQFGHGGVDAVHAAPGRASSAGPTYEVKVADINGLGRCWSTARASPSTCSRPTSGARPPAATASAPSSGHRTCCRPGCPGRWRARASNPPSSAPPPGPTAPPRSPTTDGPCTSGPRTAPRTRPPARR